MRIIASVSIAALACFASVANAAGFSKVGVISRIQADSHMRAGYADVYWVAIPGAWGGTCGAEWVYFDARENPHLVATVLTARALGASVSIYVDDALPKIGGVACQLLAIEIQQ